MTISSTNPAVGYNNPLYCARPFSSFETSLHVARCKSASASGPLTVSSPRCETSNSPTCSRTAACSSRMPLNCPGNSHPPKSTIFPPSSCSTALRGVFLRVGSVMVASGSGRTLAQRQMLNAGCSMLSVESLNAEGRPISTFVRYPLPCRIGGYGRVGVQNEIGDFLDYLTYEKNSSP